MITWGVSGLNGRGRDWKRWGGGRQQVVEIVEREAG